MELKRYSEFRNRGKISLGILRAEKALKIFSRGQELQFLTEKDLDEFIKLVEVATIRHDMKELGLKPGS